MQHTSPSLASPNMYLPQHPFSPTQDHADIGTGTRHSHLHGVAFPVLPEALTAIQQFKNKQVAYIQMVRKSLSKQGH